MITVAVYINGKAIFARSARNLSADDAAGFSKYKVDTGEIITHRQSDGALVLAKMLLDTVQEP